MADPIKKYVVAIYAGLLAILMASAYVSLFTKITAVGGVLRLISLCIVVFSFIGLIRVKGIVLPKGKLRPFVLFLCLYQLLIIIRGEWALGPVQLLTKIVNTGFSLIYLLPIIILFLPNYRYRKVILRVFFYSTLLIIPLWIFNVGNLVQSGSADSYKAEGIGMWLPYFSAFLLPMGGKEFSTKEKVINFFIFALYFILMLLNARRNVCLTMSIFLVLFFCFKASSMIKARKIHKFTPVVISAFCVIVGLLMWKPIVNGPLAFIYERGLENTRVGAEVLFYEDMRSSSPSVWVFGKGMDGGYEHTTVNDDTGDVEENRQLIETGYLNQMLKGGLVYDIMLLIAIFVAIRRLVKTGRMEFKYYAAVLGVYILDMYTTNPVCVFNPRSILFWFLISISFQCLNEKSPIRHEL